MSWKQFWDQQKNIWQRLGTNILVGILATVLLIVNLVFPSIESKEALRVDLTRNNIYTLSRQSKDVLDALREEIYLYAVYSPGNEDVRVQELLAEYGAYSPYIRVNAISNELLKTTEGLIGLEPIENGIIISNGDHSITKTFSFAELYTTDETGQNIAFKAEAKITATIQSILQNAFCNVRMLTGHGETMPADLSSFIQMLDGSNFQVSQYDLSASTEVLNADTDVLIIVSPKADLEYSEHEAILQFMNEGGRLLLFMDRSSFNTTQGVLQLYTTELPLFSSLLADYNIAVNDDLIVSRDADTINLRRTSFGARPMMHDITAQLHGQGMEVVVHEAASLRFLYGGEAQVTALLCANDRCFAKPLREEIDTFHFETGDASGNFFVGAISSKGESQLVIITDSLCIGDDALSVAGNSLFFDRLVHDIAPLQPPAAIAAKLLDTPTGLSGGGMAQMSLIFVCLIVAPFAVLYIGMRIRAGKRKK